MDRRGMVIGEIMIILLLVGALCSFAPSYFKSSDEQVFEKFVEMLDSDIAYVSIQSSSKLKIINVRFYVDFYRIQSSDGTLNRRVDLNPRLKLIKPDNSYIQFGLGVMNFTTTFRIECGDRMYTIRFLE